MGSIHVGQNSTFSRTASTQTNKDICTGTTCADPGIFCQGGGPGSSPYFTVYRGGPIVLLHIFQGGPTFSRGGGGPNANFYRNPYNYNLWFSRGVWTPYPPSGSAHGQCGILARIGSDDKLLLSLETPNANRSIVFKWLAKDLIRLRTCAGWSKPLVLAHTTLLEISYCGHLWYKNALRLYIRTKIVFVL